ncbi:hypothetical protein GGU11DRAFT_751474 [Lentinula aff. detonsa]|nr:hypothetical protein GGU11DRAFT_751474 [Lentinula aff. detonsa]
MPKKKGTASAARAREGLAAAHRCLPEPPPLSAASHETEVICISSNSDLSLNSHFESEDLSEDEVEELDGPDLTKSLAVEAQFHKQAFKTLMIAHTGKDWGKAERSLPRGKQTGHAPRTINEHRQREREKLYADTESHKSTEAKNFRNYFGFVKKQPEPDFPVVQIPEAPLHLRELAKQLAARQVDASNYCFAHGINHNPQETVGVLLNNSSIPFHTRNLPASGGEYPKQSRLGESIGSHLEATGTSGSSLSSDVPITGCSEELVFNGYLSDYDVSDSESEHEEDETVTIPDATRAPITPTFSTQGRKRQATAMQLDNIAPPKRRKLNPDQIQSAFADITQHLKSAKSKPHAGSEGLEARRARAIQSTLHSMVNNRSSFVYASCIAAEAAMFAKDWGSRLVRRWVRDWINVRSLPQSNRGRHSKINSVLSDSTVRAVLPRRE